MKGMTSWSFSPYRPPEFDVGEIYICRIAPAQNGFCVEWLPLEGVASYTVQYRLRGSDTAFEALTVQGTAAQISGLLEGRDYECRVIADGKQSRLRLVRTGFVPGDSVVNYLHPDDRAYGFSGQFLCSPSLLRHPKGFLLASMDVYKSNAPQNLTLIFRSDDDGQSWHYLTELYPCFWGKLFLHRGELYMLAVSTEYGDLLIGRSDDGGKTWGMPTVLLRGSGRRDAAGVHKNPQPILSHNGRLWTSLEWGCWVRGGHSVMCASIDENADLLKAENWSFSHPVPYDNAWEGTAVGKSGGCLEGCMTVGPDGTLYNMLRYEIGGCKPSFGKAILMRPNVGDPEGAMAFECVVDFPGNHAKFVVVFDEGSGRYLSIVSYLDAEHPKGRNLLSLIASRDLVHWELVTHIFDYRHLPENQVGFQYVDFFIEGEDILFLCRTAFNGAANFHDANYSTFTRLRDFRKWL
jgi:hypothetical protein